MYEACPWMPKALFFEENRVAFDGIFNQIAHDFPKSGVEHAYTPEGELPSSKAMQWMWTYLMGRQHGSTEGFEGKIHLTPDKEAPYWRLLQNVHYGPYSFTKPHLANSEDSCTNCLVLGGFPQEIMARFEAALPDAKAGNVAATTLLVGQRLRWHTVIGERSLEDIYAAVAQQNNIDISQLRDRSPWMRAEERKAKRENDEWSGPFATEFEIGRLCTEAFFYDMIDWKNYEVSVTYDPSPAEQTYRVRGKTRTVPPRTEVLLTYELLNGTKVHILNGEAIARPWGMPRPTSDSQTREVVELGIIGSQNERIVASASLPHVRAGLDIIIRLLDLTPDSIASTEIVTHPLLPDKEVLAGLGEIPATHKADLRLRTLLAGGDPDAPELLSL